MTTLTESMHREHGALLGDVEHIRLAAREIPDLSPEERALLRDRVLAFLRGALVPHSLLEESGLYPEVAAALGSQLATAPMIYDHLAIRERIVDLAEADPRDGPRLQELLYGLHALIKVHFWKEEELYLPLVER